MTKRSSESGFTLVELLIVIVIIGILASVVLSVINPARQQRRAREAVLRATTNKVCLALFSCASATGAVASCNDLTLIGIAPDPGGGLATSTPPLATYVLATAGNVITATGTLPDPDGAGAMTACSYACSHDFAAGTSTNLGTAAGCLP